jgi:hypothetical protein
LAPVVVPSETVPVGAADVVEGVVASADVPLPPPPHPAASATIRRSGVDVIVSARLFTTTDRTLGALKGA